MCDGRGGLQEEGRQHVEQPILGVPHLGRQRVGRRGRQSLPDPVEHAGAGHVAVVASANDFDSDAGPETRPHWQCAVLTALPLAFADFDLLCASEEVDAVYIGPSDLAADLGVTTAALGQTIGWQDSGGVCDGNNIAACGIPVVDTMGVRGGAIHSPQEYMIVPSLQERAALSALVLARLAEGEML